MHLFTAHGLRKHIVQGEPHALWIKNMTQVLHKIYMCLLLSYSTSVYKLGSDARKSALTNDDFHRPTYRHLLLSGKIGLVH